MNEDLIKAVEEFFPESSSKTIITDPSLNILYTSRPNLFKALSEDMFSESIFFSGSEKIFPVTSRRTLSLLCDGINYIAMIRPISFGGESLYFIEVLDSTDFSELEQQSQSARAEQNCLSVFREAASNIYAAQLILSEKAQREDFDCHRSMKMLDKCCYLLLSTTINKTELQYYVQNTLRRETVNLSEMTEDICRMCISYLRGRNITFDLSGIVPNILMSFDPDRYTAVLLNLIVNAADYNISEDKIIRVSVKKADGEIRIAVKDNGLGMSLDDIEKAFVPYALCKPGGTKTGLGLPIVNMFAASLGGSANIVSKENEGTMVVIRIPCQTVYGESLHAPAQKYLGDRFSPISIYLSQIKYKDD